MNRLLMLLVLVSLIMHVDTLYADSLFNASNYHAFTADNKAKKVGDIVTVQIYESSSATTSADTGTRKKENAGVALNRNGSPAHQYGIGTNSDFDGGGRTQRSNRLLATISVPIKEILANGDFLISGEQIVSLNDESQKVSLEGKVRPQDISEGNTVVSNRISDAKIFYLGEGDVTDKQRRSWWRKLLDGIGI